MAKRQCSTRLSVGVVESGRAPLASGVRAVSVSRLTERWVRSPETGTELTICVTSERASPREHTNSAHNTRDFELGSCGTVLAIWRPFAVTRGDVGREQRC